jgi:transposase-like protein
MRSWARMARARSVSPTRRTARAPLQKWRYVYRAIDQHGQVIDVPLSARRDAAAARRFFHRALSTLKVKPVEVITDAAPVYPAVVDGLVPSAWHHVEQYANNPIEADHGRLKHRLRPMRGLRTDRTAQVIIVKGTPSYRTYDATLRTWR